MWRSFHSLLQFLLIILTGGSLLANTLGAGTIPPLDYTHDGLEVTITDCDTSYNGILTVPATIEGLPVVAIGDAAFQNCTGITEVTLPASIEMIGEYGFNRCFALAAINLPVGLSQIEYQTFRDCRALPTIAIPEGVTQIGERAFERCIALESISLPDSLDGIGNFAFKDCIELDTFTLPAGLSSLGIGVFSACVQVQNFHLTEPNTSFSVVGGVLFDEAEAELVSFPVGRDGSYQIPEGVTAIRAWAFNAAIYLDEIDFPASLVTLGEGSFNDCIELSSIELPTGVTAVPDYCFENCESLETLSLPDSITAFHPGSLRFADALRHIDVDPANARYSSPDGILFDNNQSTLVRYPPQRQGNEYAVADGIVAIEDYAFEDSAYLRRVFLPDGLSSIGFAAFSECALLEVVGLPNSLNTVGAFAFYQSPNLTALYFLGNAPTDAYRSYGNSDELTAYFFEGAVGFSAPTWTYDTVSETSIPSIQLPVASQTPFVEWKVRNGYRHDTESSAFGYSTYSVLGEYALGLGLSDAATPPLSGTNEQKFELRFYAERADINYTVETNDLQSTWETEGVTLSALDANGYRTASIPLVDKGFLRIVFEEQP